MPSKMQLRAASEKPKTALKTFHVTFEFNVKAENAIQAFHEVYAIVETKLKVHTITIDLVTVGFRWERYGRRTDG